MISLFLNLCESLGISIMFVVLLLNGGEWCELWSVGNNTTTKGTWDLKLNIMARFVWILVVEFAFIIVEALLTCDEKMNARNKYVLFVFIRGCSCFVCCTIDLLESSLVFLQT
jgi:hypothetical protein